MAKAKKTATKAVAAKKKPAGKKTVKPSKPARPASKPVAKKTAKKKTVVKKVVKKKAVTAPVKKAAVPKKVVVKKVAPQKAAPAPEPAKKKVMLKSSGGAVEAQQKIYVEGVDLLNERKYSQAAARFGKAAEGPDAGVRHSATVYLRICQQRMQNSAPEPKTAEDRYNAAIALINNRELEEAARLLRLALKQEPKAAHLHYALAVASSLAGEVSEATSCLEKAIELDPQNRILALRDSDLSDLRGTPAFVALLSDDQEGAAASE